MAGGLNVYIYAANTPLLAIDQFGLDTSPDSPNPGKPKSVRPKVRNIVCAVVNANAEKRQQQIDLATANHKRRLELLEESCDIRIRNCEKFDEPVLDPSCVACAATECRKQLKAEFEQFDRSLELINKAYPTLTRLEALCNFLAGRRASFSDLGDAND